MPATKVDMLSPVAPPPKADRPLAPRLTSVDGKTVGYRIDWWNFEDFVERIQELLEQHAKPAGSRTLNKVAATYGVGDIFKTRDHAGRTGRAGREAQVQRAIDDFAGQVDWAIVGLAG